MVYCDKCGSALRKQPYCSSCNCLPHEMVCTHCHQVVGRTGTDSDGFGVYQHEPCGVVGENECTDPRPEQLRLM